MSKPSLISTNPSTSGIDISLHPLVLLTVSDYLTRHEVRQLKGPVVGALLGTQQGRKVDIESAFEIKCSEGENGEITVEGEWLGRRLGLFKETHPSSDLLGWFTISYTPTFEPTPSDLHIHTQLLPFNESPLLLLLNPTAAAAVGGKLPIALFESIYEAPSAAEGSEADDGKMQVDDDGEEKKEEGKEGGLLKFVGPLKYTLETGEAEMIGVDLIAKGVGNAVVEAEEDAKKEDVKDVKGKGKQKEEKEGLYKDAGGSEELVAALQSKANAIKMLHARIQLLRAYLAQISSGASEIPPSHPILRSLKSLTFSRLNLVLPPALEGNTALSSLNIESIQEENEVRLVALMGALLKSVKELQGVGKKFQVLESGRSAFEQGGMYGGVGAGMVGMGFGVRGFEGRRFRRGED